MPWWCLCIYSRNHVRIYDLQYCFFVRLLQFVRLWLLTSPFQTLLIFTDRHWIGTYIVFCKGLVNYLGGGVYWLKHPFRLSPPASTLT